MMPHQEYEVRNEQAELVAVCPTFDVVCRMVKHHQPDGEYLIVGPGYDCTIARSNGVVYPTSGTFDGKKMPPQSLEEAKETFDGK